MNKLPGLLLSWLFLFAMPCVVAWLIARYESLPWWKQAAVAGWMWGP